MYLRYPHRGDLCGSSDVIRNQRMNSAATCHNDPTKQRGNLSACFFPMEVVSHRYVKVTSKILNRLQKTNIITIIYSATAVFESILDTN